jgi:hypothetical protein
MGLNGNLLLRRLVLLGTPLVLGLLEIWHPIVPAEGVFDSLAPHVRWWTILHLLQLPLFGLLALAVVLLTWDLQGRLVTLIRVAMGSFVIFYGALDSIAGIANGIVVSTGLALGPEHHAALETITYNLFGSPVVFALSITGALSWLVGLVATAVVLRRQGAPLYLLALSGLFFGYSHAPPLGPLGMLFFLIAAGWLEFGRALERQPRGALA